MAQIYRKDSFNRFDDDLTELVLSYLSFERKFSFECVCNRWRSHVFAKELKYELSRNKFKCRQKRIIRSYGRHCILFGLDPTLFKSLMKKFIHLNELIIDNNCKCDENVLRIFIDLKQSSLKSLNYLNIRIKEDINNEVLIKFSQFYGQTLTNVSIDGLSEQRLATVLSFFRQNLKTIHLNQNLRSLLLSNQLKDGMVLLKLKDVSLTNPLIEEFKEFVDKYGQQLKQFSLSFDENYKQNIKNTLKYVSDLANLQVFRLDSEQPLNRNQFIDEKLQLIGQKYLSLYSVDIYIFGHLISDGFLETIGKSFDCLEHLQLALYGTGNKYFQMINGFGFRFHNGRHLFKLNLMVEELTDDHLKDIHLILPNLRAIGLNTYERLTSECLRHLSKLNNLRTLALGGYMNLNSMRADGIYEFVENFPTLRILDILFEYQ